jgi:hypothetical protein
MDADASSELIEVGNLTLAASRRICAQSDKLRDETNALSLTYRQHRFPQLVGGTDITDDYQVRRLLHDFCAGVGRPKSFVGLSRGSVCQACDNIIKPGALEYDVVVGTSELRVDADCYTIFAEESRAIWPDDPPHAA